MKIFIKPLVREIMELFASKTNTCTSNGSGHNNQCSKSGM